MSISYKDMATDMQAFYDQHRYTDPRFRVGIKETARRALVCLDEIARTSNDVTIDEQGITTMTWDADHALESMDVFIRHIDENEKDDVQTHENTVLHELCDFGTRYRLQTVPEWERIRATRYYTALYQTGHIPVASASHPYNEHDVAWFEFEPSEPPHDALALASAIPKHQRMSALIEYAWRTTHAQSASVAHACDMAHALMHLCGARPGMLVGWRPHGVGPTFESFNDEVNHFIETNAHTASIALLTTPWKFNLMAYDTWTDEQKKTYVAYRAQKWKDAHFCDDLARLKLHTLDWVSHQGIVACDSENGEHGHTYSMPLVHDDIGMAICDMIKQWVAEAS